jgi:hypothetical protein
VRSWFERIKLGPQDHTGPLKKIVGIMSIVDELVDIGKDIGMVLRKEPDEFGMGPSSRRERTTGFQIRNFVFRLSVHIQPPAYKCTVAPNLTWQMPSWDVAADVIPHERGSRRNTSLLRETCIGAAHLRK